MEAVFRDIHAKISPWLGGGKILIIKGSRQVGKSTLLRYLETKLRQKGELVFSYSIDKEWENPIFKTPSLLQKFLIEQSNDKKFYLLLDEFQYLQDSGLFLKVLYDGLKGKCQIIVSGSSSLEIAKSSEFLTGRKLEFRMETFNFREYLRACSKLKLEHQFSFKNINEMQEFGEIYSQELKYQFNQYLAFGGYPEIVLEKNLEKKQILLSELISTYLKKDVSAFLKIENISAYNNLIRLLTNQRGNLLNKSELSSTLNISFETVSKYLDTLEGTFLFSYLPPYFTNVRKEISKMPKVYVEDAGIIRHVLKSQNLESYETLPGHDIENYCFRYFRKIFGTENIYFHRTISKSEIDFVGMNESGFFPIEVKFTKKIANKPTLAMKNFSENYKNIPFYTFVTKETLHWDAKIKILYIPVYMLEFFDIVEGV